MQCVQLLLADFRTLERHSNLDHGPRIAFDLSSTTDTHEVIHTGILHFDQGTGLLGPFPTLLLAICKDHAGYLLTLKCAVPVLETFKLHQATPTGTRKLTIRGAKSMRQGSSLALCLCIVGSSSQRQHIYSGSEWCMLLSWCMSISPLDLSSISKNSLTALVTAAKYSPHRN